MINIARVLFLSLAFLGSSAGLASAEIASGEIDAVTKVVDSIKSTEINYAEISRRLSTMENQLKSSNAESSELSADVKRLSETRAKLSDAKKQNERELEFVQKRIEALGPEPADGSQELEAIAKKRKEFNEEASYQKGQIAEVDVLLAKIDELDALIINVRNSQLLGSLLAYNKPLIYPANLFHATTLFVEFSLDILESPIKWYQGLDEEQQAYVKSNVIPVLFVALLSLWLGIWLRLFIMRHFGYDKDIEHPRYGKKVFAAIFVAIAYGVIPATIIAGFMIWMYSTKVMNSGFFGIVINSFLFYTLLVVLARAISRVCFAPYNGKWRLVNVDTEKAKHMTSALYFTVFMLGIVSFLQHVATAANYPIELINYISVFASAVKGLCIVLVVKRYLWDGIDAHEPEDGAPENPEEDAQVNLAFKITFSTTFFVVVAFIISLLGYARLSAFIFNRFLLTVIGIGLLLVMRKALGEFLHRILLMRFWVKTFKLRRKIVSKIDFWSNLIVDPLFVLAGIFMVLSIWGVSTDILIQSAKKILVGFKVGEVEISPLAILLGLVSFFVALAVVKALKVRLVNNVLAKMDIDDGIRHSLASGFGFIGFIIAAIIAITMMGGNLSNLALIASALSVGIGFGLQNVINNFVSGIIILFERPIKVGDWVIIDGEEGQVKQINIRSTEIETFKKASLIIPNATLLSSSVTNLTHGNNWSRQAISVGVAYGSDVKKVTEILLDIAAKNKYVLKNPAPYVLFKDFGSSSLDFELRCYTNNIWNGWRIPSEIRYEINERFIEEGIEIPFPQIVVHSGEKVAEENQFYAKRRAARRAAETQKAEAEG